MITRLKQRLFNRQKTTASIPPPPPAPSGPDVGLLDMRHTGWLDAQTGELLEGFCIRAEDTVLDIGCGSGGFTLFSGRQGAEVYVADIDAKNVETAVRRLQETPARAIHAIVSDANPLPIPDATMTRVVAMEVLEHVDDPAHFLSELVRVGKPGAQYLISVPDAMSENAQRGVANEAMFRKPNHIHVFEREEFDRLVTEAGLLIEKRVHYGFYRTVWWFFYWASQPQELSPPWHPLLIQWDETWRTLLSLPQGPQIKHALDQALPKSQVLIARKP